MSAPAAPREFWNTMVYTRGNTVAHDEIRPNTPGMIVIDSTFTGTTLVLTVMCYVEAGSYIRNNFTIIARLYGADHKFIGAIEELGEYSTIVRKIIAEKHLHIIKPIEPPAPKIFADQSVATRNAAISALELVNALFATGAELRAFMKDKSFTVENIHTNIETLKISSPGVLGGPRVEYRFHRGLDWHPSVEAFLRLYRE